MAVCSPRRLGRCRVTQMGVGERGTRGRGGGRAYGAAKVGILRLWQGVGGAGKDLWVFSVPETAFSIGAIKLITYFHGSRALDQPDAERSQEHYLKAIKMHAKRTLFNYGKIFVITRPLPSTIPIPTLFSQPSCLALRPTTPTTNTNSPMSSERPLTWRAIRTQVGPLCLVLSHSPCDDR